MNRTRRRWALLILAIAASFSLLMAAPATPANRRVLLGTVGPGFTIMLKTPRGTAVKRLKAGTYTVRIRDLSAIHNFHLSGPGLNKLTSVQKTGRTTWVVRFRRGTYRFVCDPHLTIMRGSFKVS